MTSKYGGRRGGDETAPDQAVEGGKQTKKRRYKPGESTKRVRALRERRRAAQNMMHAGVTAPPEAIKQAAASIANASAAARSMADQTATLGDAFGAGMAAAMFRTILDGHAEREQELRGWLARPQACKWMFLHYLTQQGIYGDFLAWSGEISAAGA